MDPRTGVPVVERAAALAGRTFDVEHHFMELAWRTLRRVHHRTDDPRVFEERATRRLGVRALVVAAQAPRTRAKVLAGLLDVVALRGIAADAGANADTAMPGMASGAELTRLRSLTGSAFDVEFLQLMIRHHEGGRPMAQYGAAHAAVPAVRRLATTIADTQAAETQTLTAMLTARGGAPLPAP